ncbi:MAG TPA: low affinity iron permease family protein [Thermoanaerobaculia bacterium]|nr:low affinity iron permease family protein [Thermoanaerobaculia bacterium]
MNPRKGWSSRFATWVSIKVGSTPAFMLALLVIVAWACTGPIFHFSDTWQLIINTGTTIVTFLMVFLIQHAQNRESLAVQLKLNEIVAAIDGASNRLVSVEDLDDDELEVLHKHYRELAKMAGREREIVESHSVDEAKERHARKAGKRKK